jgi:K+-sensing histidine kinase KdpD
MSQETIQNRAIRRFEIIREIALSATEGENLSETAEQALSAASSMLGLSASSLILWDDENKISLAVAHSESDQGKSILARLEEDLFATLRKEKQLVSAYMSFAGETPMAAFTLPLRRAEKIFGALIGVQPGKGSLVKEDIFLETIAASFSLVVLAGRQPSAEAISARIKKERLDAIIQTAATVSHEINNPLTAILGNIQLLLLKNENLNEELVKKLKIIEESSLRIKEVTQKLMNITQDKITDYVNGVKMIDINEDNSSSS